jgi:hypothetical protein
MAVSRRLRFEILRRDGMTCRYCGAKAPDVVLTVDHVIPVTLGGGDEPNNLVTACADCNSGKSSVPADAALVEDVDATALLFAKAMERATVERRRELGDLRAVLGDFDRSWCEFTPSTPGGPYRPNDWMNSIEVFLSFGLTPAEIDNYVDVAMGSKASHRNVWRYFCGCCWNEINRRQELARRLIEDGEV